MKYEAAWILSSSRVKRLWLLWPFVVANSASTFAQAAASSLSDLYQIGRQTRIHSGHSAAQPLYAEILERNPSDLTTSTRLASSSGTPLRLLQTACSSADAHKLALLREWFVASDFTCGAVGNALNVPNGASRAPIYVTPAAAGTVHHFPFSLVSLTVCQCLTALFLLGLAVPAAAATRCCSEQRLQWLMDVGLICHCEYDDNVLLAVVSIMPIDLRDDSSNDDGDDDARNPLYVVTDWHPRVLNTIQIFDEGTSASSEEEAVMYIGPDSLALVQHWILHPNLRAVDSLLDVCTGSGVQALACLATHKCQAAVCVDINPRALRFTAFSAALNGLSDAVTLVQGDLLRGTGRLYSKAGRKVQAESTSDVSLVDLLQNLAEYGMLTANPPFLPVPEAASTGRTVGYVAEAITDEVVARHGLFSAGGSSGEAVLAAILVLSNTVLKAGGFAAIVSEFFFQNDEEESASAIDVLLCRLHSYWESNRERSCYTDDAFSSKGILLTNEFPISASLYAERRADSAREAVVWKHHLDRENIATCSPGLLYVQKMTASSTRSEFLWTPVVVPKSVHGSIWTPSNPVGVQFTQAASRDVFDM